MKQGTPNDWLERVDKDHPFVSTLTGRFGGVLLRGAHCPDGEGCVNEVLNISLGLEWSDSPGDFPDFSSLNDACWSSDETRTAHLTPLIVSLWDWTRWDAERRVEWSRVVALRVVRELLPPTLELVNIDGALIAACREAEDLAAAGDAARAAAKAAAGAASAAMAAAWAASAARAARDAAKAAAKAAAGAASAARAARDAAKAAAGAASAASAAMAAAWAASAAMAAAGDAGDAGDEPLTLICQIMIDAAGGELAS